MSTLADVQNHVDTRGIVLGKVGVTGVYHPLVIRDQANETQTVTARFDIFVGLHPDQRGAHLSHLVEGLHKYASSLFSMDDLVTMLRDNRLKQDQKGIPFVDANIQIGFKYFVEKTAPSSGLKSLVGYDCGFDVELNGSGYKAVSVTVPVSTVCPCSKEISDEGAHNQRANITIVTKQPLDDTRIIWLEDLISLAERSGSGEVFTTLRRIDEKTLTERMFESPAFVEDVVRNAVQKVKEEVGAVQYTVKCESFESIHPHNAYAESQGEC